MSAAAEKPPPQAAPFSEKGFYLEEFHGKTLALAVPAAELRQPDVTFWSAWSGSELVGCGALRELDPRHGEIKSMRTVSARRRRGVGRAMLTHIVAEARRRSYERLSLETGSMQEFEPARRLYASFGFAVCAPFGDYREDPNSVFMTRALGR